MARIVLLQMATALIVALIAGGIAGPASAISALCGGLSCALPNALFALRLFVSARKPGGANPINLFMGEFIKIALTIGMMGMTIWLYRDLHWLAFLIGTIAVLKSYFILFFRHSS